MWRLNSLMLPAGTKKETYSAAPSFGQSTSYNSWPTFGGNDSIDHNWSISLKLGRSKGQIGAAVVFTALPQPTRKETRCPKPTRPREIGSLRLQLLRIGSVGGEVAKYNLRNESLEFKAVCMAPYMLVNSGAWASFIKPFLQFQSAH